MINDDDGDDDVNDTGDSDDDEYNLYGEQDPQQSYRSHYLVDNDEDKDLDEVSTRDQVLKHQRKLENEFKRKYVDGIPKDLDWRKYGKL